MPTNAPSEKSHTNSTKPLCVILCTYNPRQDYFALALRSVGSQTLPHSQFDFIVVDNNSTPPLDASQLEQITGIPVQLVSENKQGLTNARIAGLNATTHELVVFVDDDNQLDPTYLEHALRISNEHPDVGAYGGIAEGVLEHSSW